MGLTFTKPLAKKAHTEYTAPAEQAAPKTKLHDAPPNGKGLTFLKKGVEARAAIEHEQAKDELAKAERDKLWRFWMPPEEERQITFLDGNMDGEGMLDIGMFYEHSITIGGDRRNFICTNDLEGTCPICDKGDSKAYLVGAMTICDHTPHKISKGPNAGKIIKNTRKLFIAKKQTVMLLTKYAAKRGGLAGCTFDVTRGNDRTPAVGQSFDFVSKMPIPELAAKLDMKVEDLAPADYSKELTYHTADELIELGIGKAASGPGYGKAVDKKALEDQM